ncbi:alpha/beta hydrolase [Enterobacter sp. UNJFSC 003]|uniref:RBBP9/YdeN family alpha/beta hydrolase n=1 Tax=Enterobacter sp. UNJFSC 003 TaxID=3122077 RepID=UPI002EA223D6|nr:alpha/beta hydrolase [Serratia liquefaciens]
MIEQRLQQLSDRYTLILVPGLRDSDEYHWQSCWERRLPFWKRIQQKNWLAPDIENWVSAIRRELAVSRLPAVLVGHSFGALASCRLLQTQQVNVAGLVMVAPAEPAFFGLEEAIQPTTLSVPCILFASKNDPLMPFFRAQYWATCWGGHLIDIGEAGHINSESGYGEWQYGLERLTEFCEQL